MWHNIKYEDDGAYQTILYDDAYSHLSYIKEQEDEIWIATFTDAIKYIREKQNAIIVRKIQNKDFIVFTVKLDSTLPKKVFDSPLTVKVQLPVEWYDYNSVFANGENCEILGDLEKYVIVNCLPFEEITIKGGN